MSVAAYMHITLKLLVVHHNPCPGVGACGGQLTSACFQMLYVQGWVGRAMKGRPHVTLTVAVNMCRIVTMLVVNHSPSVRGSTPAAGCTDVCVFRCSPSCGPGG